MVNFSLVLMNYPLMNDLSHRKRCYREMITIPKIATSRRPPTHAVDIGGGSGGEPGLSLWH